MIRTQVQLTEEQFAALKAMAAAEGVPMAELIRRGIDLITQVHGGVSRQDRVRRALAAAGRFHSGLGDLARRHDDYLEEAF